MTFDPEAYLNSLEAIGWKLGLERMELLSDELGRPQDSYETIHVVGTNGKSSVARMSAALLDAHGLKSGCSISPHLNHWSDRVMVGGRDIEPEDFSSAVERTATAVASVNTKLEEGEVVTQFEVATAAAFLALADAGVEAAAIEAGLGGRLDATNSIASKVTVLTSIGLDHTEYLGETELEIAAEKLAVLREGTTLVIGRLSQEVEGLARSTAADRDCDVVAAVELSGPKFELASPGRFQRENFRAAAAAVEALIGRLDPEAVRSAAGTVIVPGRMELIADQPPVYVDVAHNPAGAAALAASIPEVAEGRPVIALIGVLADKDAAGMLSELAGVIDLAIFTELPGAALEAWGRPGARSFPVTGLVELADHLGLDSEAFDDPAEAMSRAVSLAADRRGMVLAAGSHFLLSAIQMGDKLRSS